MPTISSVEPPEPDIVTHDDDSNDPTSPYGFAVQQPSVPASLNHLNLLPNPFNILTAMTVVQQNPTQHDDNYSPQSPEPSDPSPVSTPPMNVSTIDGWETPHTTTVDNTIYSEDEPRRVYWTSPLDETFHQEGEPRRICLQSSPSTPPTPRKIKSKLELRMSFAKRTGVSQHVCEKLRTINSPNKGQSKTVS